MKASPQLAQDQIPTLIFGGLVVLPHAACVAIRLPECAPGACRDWLRALVPLVTHGHASQTEPVHLVALTATGLSALGLHADDLATFPSAFVNGMTSPQRARALGDTGANAPEHWTWGNADSRTDAAVLIYAPDANALRAAIKNVETTTAAARGAVLTTILTQVRAPGNTREPFGFADGISQPVIPGTPDARDDPPAQHIVAAGEFVLGYPDNRGYMPPVPTLASYRAPGAPLPRGPNGGHDLGRDSTFLVIRQLRQDVAGFDAWTKQQAAAHGMDDEMVAAKTVGRWRNGSSLMRYPHKPGPAREPDNDFAFSTDRDALNCPRGAHIRRANPRDGFHAGSSLTDPFAITNRHRILRVGRPYVDKPDGSPAGLLFMCLNADIERQFEFLQQTWVMRPNFDRLRDEADPLVGQNNGTGRMTVATGHGPVCFEGLRNFVTPVGGAYCWLPSRRVLTFLAGADW